MSHIYDVIILGGGPAGLSAGIYAGRARLDALIIEKGAVGGQAALTADIENYPGQLAQGETGGSLARRMADQAERFGALRRTDTIRRLDLRSPVKELEGTDGAYRTRSVILAPGARPRPIGCENEDRFIGRGVSYCATCDGGFYKGKTTVVIGGGNTAVEDALYLANICEEVHLIHRRDAFRAGKVLVDSLLSRENIVIHYDTVPVEVLPDEGGKVVGALKVKNVKTGAETEIPAQGVFVAVGLVPDNKVFEGQVDLDPAGYIAAGEDTRTNLPGVFAAGDTRTKALRQIITAAGDGAVAASEAGSYLMQG